MKNKFRLLLILSLGLGVLLTSSAGFSAALANPLKYKIQQELAPPVKWAQHNLKLNNIGVGVESVQKILFVPLGNGFNTPTNYDMTFTYKPIDPDYQFTIKGTVINNGSRFRFKGISYGSMIPLQRSLNGVVETYTLLFTNLPVLQLNAAKIIDEPKSPGTFRLMSGQFKQDTGILRMGIEFRGMGTQKYAKKSLGVQMVKATARTKSLNVKLLDLNNDSDWILDAVYVDTTFFRNVVSQDIFRAIHPGAYSDKQGVAHGQAALKGHLIEVIKNGSYDGVYSLNEKPSRKMYELQKINVPVDAKGLPQWHKVDFTKPENGSVLYKSGVFKKVFFDAISVKTNFEQVYPKLKDAERWLPLMRLANFVAKADDQKFATDIAKWIDIDSVVDWWSLVLASHAEDNIRHNFMLAKSGSGKFYLLPWDHEGSFGVKWFAFKPDSNNLIKRLLKLPAFNAKLKARWEILRATELSQKKMVARFTAYINESNKGGARGRNVAHWPQHPTDAYMGTATYINRYLASWLPEADKFIQALPEK